MFTVGMILAGTATWTRALFRTHHLRPLLGCRPDLKIAQTSGSNFVQLPYLLVSQPIRRYMLDQMGKAAREAFLESLADLSLGWVDHQRRVALAALRDRRTRPKRTREGLLLERDQGIRLVLPDDDSQREEAKVNAKGRDRRR